MTKAELQALIEIEEIKDRKFRDDTRRRFLEDDNFRIGYMNGRGLQTPEKMRLMQESAAAYAEELERRKKAEAQRDKARAELDKARKQNKANSRSATAAEAVRDDCRRQLEAERARRKELEAEVNRLKARVLDLLDKATA